MKYSVNVAIVNELKYSRL